jgi:hypothetical protein
MGVKNGEGLERDGMGVKTLEGPNRLVYLVLIARNMK